MQRLRKMLDERAAAKDAAEREGTRVAMHVADATDLREHRLEESGFEGEAGGGFAGYTALAVVVAGVLAAVYYVASP